jgi:hypothetical protein
MKKLTLAAGLIAAFLFAPAAAHAETYPTTFKWSGYTWQARHAVNEGPGNNNFCAGNVSVKSDGLHLALVTKSGRYCSSMVRGKYERGYGTYTWVVSSDLSAQNPWDVSAFFTHDIVTKHRGEQDLEFARWGEPQIKPGWWVSWSNTKSAGNFDVTSDAPYTLQISWYRSGYLHFTVRGSDGEYILNKTTTTKVSGRYITSYMSHWIFQDTKPKLPAHPADLVIRSFKFTKQK